MIPGEKIALDNLDKLVEHHMAFSEAVSKYEEERGNFLGFAKLVIESRLKTHFEKKKKEAVEVSLEAMQEEGLNFAEEEEEEHSDSLHEEILQYREELLLFGLTLEILADHAPKHRDTRKTAVTVAETASEDEETVEETYQKKKLSIRRVANLAKVTEKIVKGSKEFILAVMIIFVKQFPELVYWIKGARCHHRVS